MSASDTGPERFETVIVGGGQAGLATGYHLARRGRPFVILDAGRRVGDPWRARWDSLRLYTPARYSGLPGWGFPAAAWHYPGRDELADYLEAYVARFELPVRNGVRVDGLTRRGLLSRSEHPVSRMVSPSSERRNRRPTREPMRRTALSRRACERSPCTMSAPLLLSRSSIGRRSAGSFWRSASSTATSRPRAARNPAWNAADCPLPRPRGVRCMAMHRSQGRSRISGSP